MMFRKPRQGFVRLTSQDKEKLQIEVKQYQEFLLKQKNIEGNANQIKQEIVDLKIQITEEFEKIKMYHKIYSKSAPDLTKEEKVLSEMMQIKRQWASEKTLMENKEFREKQLHLAMFAWAEKEAKLKDVVKQIKDLNALMAQKKGKLQEILKHSIKEVELYLKMEEWCDVTYEKALIAKEETNIQMKLATIQRILGNLYKIYSWGPVPTNKSDLIELALKYYDRSPDLPDSVKSIAESSKRMEDIPQKKNSNPRKQNLINQKSEYLLELRQMGSGILDGKPEVVINPYRRGR